MASIERDLSGEVEERFRKGKKKYRQGSHQTNQKTEREKSEQKEVRRCE